MTVVEAGRPVAFEKCTIKQARMFKDLTRKYVAEQCGVSEFAMKRYEDGAQPVPFMVVKKLSEFYGISMDCFVIEN